MVNRYKHNAASPSHAFSCRDLHGHRGPGLLDHDLHPDLRDSFQHRLTGPFCGLRDSAHPDSEGGDD